MGKGKSWVRLLALLPFLVMSLLPVGLMPAVKGDGTLTLVICTPDGPEVRSIPASDDESEKASERCLFSLHAAAVVMPTVVRVAEPVVFSAAAIPTLPQWSWQDAFFVSPRPRGPPVAL
ncbi:MAG: hypothetical protein HC871_10860 [Rhizobiales bacterium]|nr:hypothetical protein [Hyphomicrobiales bacterium]